MDLEERFNGFFDQVVETPAFVFFKEFFEKLGIVLHVSQGEIGENGIFVGIVLVESSNADAGLLGDVIGGDFIKGTIIQKVSSRLEDFFPCSLRALLFRNSSRFYATSQGNVPSVESE